VAVEYLNYAEVVQLHDLLCFLYGGATDILDRGAIESALAQPQQIVFDVDRYPTPFLEAAAYCYYLCSNHGFRDGNKRIAVGAAFHFLRKNDIWPSCDQDILYDAIMRMIERRCTIEELADLLEGKPPTS
jgi:death-on-curing protein